MNNVERAEAIVADILHDLTDRRGLRQEWDNCDEDIQLEIMQTWREIVLRRLEG